MGGTLIITRKIKLHNYFKEKLTARGYRNVTATSVDRDGLISIINELKPEIIMIEPEFYKSASTYMIKNLLRRFEDIKFVVVSMFDYPAELGMWLINNGVNSYLNINEGIEEFYMGLDCIRDGKCFISSDVKEVIAKRNVLPPVASDITDREFEVLRLVCNGFTGDEIADTLHISLTTVNFHKKGLYNNLGIRNDKEAIRVAFYLKFVNEDEMLFYGGRYEVSPKPNKKKKKKEQRKMSSE
jgi:DNA-binding NarL/FixJ family response regulator